MRSFVCFFVLACSSSPTPTTPISNQAPPAIDAAPPVDAPPPVDLVAAAKLYEAKGCLACHTLDGTAKIAGTIKGLFGSKIQLTDGTDVLVDEPFIRESLLDPALKVRAGFPPTMPSYKGVLTDAEIEALIAYIKSIR